MLEKLWYDHLADECTRISTPEEKMLIKKTVDKHELARKALATEQTEIIEDYIDALLELHSLVIKKAFFNGCRFATSFMIKTNPFEKT